MKYIATVFFCCVAFIVMADEEGWIHPFAQPVHHYPQSEQGWPIAMASPLQVMNWEQYNVNQHYNHEGVAAIEWAGEVHYLWCGIGFQLNGKPSDLFRFSPRTQRIQRLVADANCSGIAQTEQGAIFLAGQKSIYRYWPEHNSLSDLLGKTCSEPTPMIGHINDLALFQSQIYFTDSQQDKLFWAYQQSEGCWQVQDLLPEGTSYSGWLHQIQPKLNDHLAAEKQRISPNGISVVHGQGRSYLVVLGLGPRAATKQFPIIKIPLAPNGHPLVHQASVLTLLPDGADGAAVGHDGTLFVGGFWAGVAWVIAPNGEIKGEIRGVPEQVVNLALDGNKLLISSRQTEKNFAQGGPYPLYQLMLRRGFTGTNY